MLSDNVILPTEAHYEGYEALRQVLDVAARIRANFKHGLAVEGILITKKAVAVIFDSSGIAYSER